MSYALVTGASFGIGEAIAAELLKQKWNVVLVARSVAKMQEISENFCQSQYLILKCDVTDSKQIEETCNEAMKFCNNSLNLLVNNAGAASSFNFSLDTCTEQEWDWTMNLNLKSSFLFTKFLKSSLVNCGKNASIINIGSIAGSKALPNLTSYCVAKAGINHLTKCNALELAKYGVRCNCIQPATVKTRFHKSTGMTDEMIKSYYQRGQSQHPIGRIGYPQDVVRMVMFLSSVEKAGWITGQCILLDGGRSLMSPLPTAKL